MIYGLFKEESFDTIISEQVRLEGDIIGQENIYINGFVIGKIIKTRQEIKIGQSAKIEASLEAKNIIIEGNVRGTIKAENKLAIKETGRVRGDIEVKILSVASGGILQGKCRVIEAEKIEEQILPIIQKEADLSIS